MERFLALIQAGISLEHGISFAKYFIDACYSHEQYYKLRSCLCTTCAMLVEACFRRPNIAILCDTHFQEVTLLSRGHATRAVPIKISPTIIQN